MSSLIVIIDDEDSNKSLISENLKDKISVGEYQLEFFNDCDLAFDFLRDNGDEVDVILTDINMSGQLDGLNLLLAIYQLDIPAKTICMSADSDMAKARKAIRNGAFDFLKKPLDTKDLALSIKRAINHVRQYRMNLQLVKTQKILKNKLTDNENKFSALANAAYDAILMVNQDNRVTYLNQAAENMFQIDMDYLEDNKVLISELILFTHLNKKKSIGQIFSPQDLSRGGTFEFLGVNILKQEFPVEVSVSPLELDKQNFLIFIVRNITERKNVEVFKRAVEIAEAQNKAKSDFLARMSHEIRTPMNAIIGMAELLLNSRLNEEQKEFARTVMYSADFLLNIINDILDFSKIEAGKLTLQKEVTSLYEMVYGAAEIVAPLAFKKNVELMTYVGPEVPLKIKTDPARLKQVLLNLLSNAIKFTDQGEVICSLELIKNQEGEDKIFFQIKDTGIGIAESDQKQLFRQFSQVNRKGAQGRMGTGLGLAISQSIIKLMEGEIKVESQLNKGSCFSFSLDSWPQAPVLPHFPNYKKGKILLFLKNTSLCHIIEKYTSRWNIQTFIPPSFDFLEPADYKNYDAIIFDESSLRKIKEKNIIEDLCSVNREALHICLVFSMNAGVDRSPDHLNYRYLIKPLKVYHLLKYLVLPLNVDNEILKDYVQSLEDVQNSRDIVRDYGHRDYYILIAEDSNINRSLLKKILTSLGLHVDEAKDGLEAFKQASENYYDLILMDVQMPQMDGLEATRQIRKSGCETPIISVTASAFYNELEECFSAGAVDCITKPFKQKDIHRVLSKYLKE